ncbi:hypothetical protein A7978_05770 (plasmid) [Borrelia turicatae]|uniref:Family 115-like protein n=1 Tax=Borrelia turicatae TaxID=142 RepID=A0A172XD06_BORTU|nr:DUF603 domain-containing protein [Borrelia turicatae]ANF34554.1 hypothetical protein A7978_05770 [Borrelia turicatae]UPA15638.1 DUF603 domain-containing protein [Borrelia turicatae]
MSKIKKSFDDYVAYFKEGKLNDVSIAKEMGVSKANVSKMRHKWESVKGNSEYVRENNLTIHEDTLTNILLHASQSTAQARDLKSQFSMACSLLGIEFINLFSRYVELELKTHDDQIDQIESKIISLSKESEHSQKENSNEDLTLKLFQLRKEREVKRMQLYYEMLQKLKATDVESRFKFQV